MKVLIVALKFFPASGGSATYAHNLASGLIQQGHEIRLVAPAYSRKNSDNELDYHVHRIWTPSRFSAKIKLYVSAIQIAWHCFLFRPDVIWASTFGGCVAVALLEFLRLPCIGTIHGGGLIRSTPSNATSTKKWRLQLGRHFIERAKCIVAVSEEAKKLICKLLPEAFAGQEPLVIYNGIEYHPDRFIEKPIALQRHPEFNKLRLLLTVGRLVKAKGHDLTIEAFNRLSPSYPDLRYVIVGEGPEKENLIAQIHRLGLEDRIIMTGYISQAELEEYYALCDIFIMAGRETEEFIEGFGLVFVEASLRGKPVIGTRVGGIPEAISDGNTGFIAEPEDVESLKKKIELLLGDSALSDRFGKNGTQWVIDRYTTAIMARENARLLSEIEQASSLQK